jgi:hypothetical protein
MEKTPRYILTVLTVSLCLSIALPGLSFANERQACLNNCTQAGATQQQKCHADYDAEMIRCGQLTTNQERNLCKRQANEKLKMCNKTAREQIKVCQDACPPKQ